MMSSTARWTIGLAATLCLGIPGGATAAQLGTVVSVAGQVYADSDGGRRLLGCGDAILEGDRVEVSESGRLGVLADDVYSQVEPRSRVRFDRAAGGGPALELEIGRVRVVDTRADPGVPRHELGTPNAAALGRATDSEAYILAEKGGAYSMVCEWAEPIEVGRADERVTAAAGQCAIARSREPLYLADAHEERIALAPLGCQAGPLLGAVAQRFNPTDVAAGPPPATGLLAPAPPAFELEPCDASSCFQINAIPLGIVESPGTPGGLPGGGPSPGELP